MSRTFSTNCGSVESLNVSVRCGCSANAFQMRCTVDVETPDAFEAIEAMRGKTLAPRAPRLGRDADRVGNLAVVHAVSGAQHDLGALRFVTGDFPPTHEPLKVPRSSSVSVILLAASRRAMPPLRISARNDRNQNHAMGLGISDTGH
jgi:hypothetical protein